MSNIKEIEKVMQERNLPYSKAKMLVEMWEREAKTEGGADFIRGYDDGQPQTTVDFNHYNNGKE